MDEILFCSSAGDSTDKKFTTSFAFLSSIHSSQQVAQYRQCYSSKNGVVLTGVGAGEKVIVACRGKALVHVYLSGKESPEQTIPVPEELTCLEICPHPNLNSSWLLVGGGKSGRLYIWELDSGYLLTVKEAHYQAVSCMKYSKCYVVSGGLDSRVVAWKVLDLVSSVFVEAGDSSSSYKPYATFSDHTLAVTDLIFNRGSVNDLKVYSVSEDSTLRCYDLNSKELVTTFVASFPIESVAADPAFRSLYVGLTNGTIRTISLFQASPKTKVLEQVGGYGKIVTLKNDPNLIETFTHHQQNTQEGEEIKVTKIETSFDGTMLVSGDSKGRIYVVDVATKQTIRTLKSLVAGVSFLKLFQVKADSLSLLKSSNSDKSIVRTIPVLKRNLLESKDLAKHEIQTKVQAESEESIDFELDEFLAQVKNEEKWFTNFSGVDSKIVQATAPSGSTASTNTFEDKQKVQELEQQIKTLSDAYESMKSKYDDLFQEHSKTLNK